MRRFVVSIERENAAFEDDGSREYEIGRILREVANKIESEPYRQNGWINDINGNRVGYFDMNA